MIVNIVSSNNKYLYTLILNINNIDNKFYICYYISPN